MSTRIRIYFVPIKMHNLIIIHTSPQNTIHQLLCQWGGVAGVYEVWCRLEWGPMRFQRGVKSPTFPPMGDLRGVKSHACHPMRMRLRRGGPVNFHTSNPTNPYWRSSNHSSFTLPRYDQVGLVSPWSHISIQSCHLSHFLWEELRVDLKLRYRWIKRCAKCCNCVNSLLFIVIVASHCLVEFGVWTSLTGYVSSPLWQRNCIALHRWCVLTAFSLWKPGNAVGNNASYSLFHRCCARELTCPNCPSCPIQYFIPRQLHLRPSSSRLNSHFPIYTPGTWYL